MKIARLQIKIGDAPYTHVFSVVLQAEKRAKVRKGLIWKIRMQKRFDLEETGSVS